MVYCYLMRIRVISAVWLGIGSLGTVPLAAQVPAGDFMTTGGIYRAAAVVDSVFIDRSIAESTVNGGDFASYLMARLGIIPIPTDLGFRVVVDSANIVLNGRVADLPAQARDELGMLLAMVPRETPVTALIDLLSAGPRAVRFRLASVTLGGIPVPEALLQTVMSQVGRRYTALTKSGRDLYVEIPEHARVILAPGHVRLIGPVPPTTNGQ